MEEEIVKKKRRHRQRNHKRKIKPLFMTLGILANLAGVITLVMFLANRINVRFAYLTGGFLTLGVLLLCITGAMKHMDSIEKE